MIINGCTFKHVDAMLCKLPSGGVSETGVWPHLEALNVQSLYCKEYLFRSRYLLGAIRLLQSLSVLQVTTNVD